MDETSAAGQIDRTDNLETLKIKYAAILLQVSEITTRYSDSGEIGAFEELQAIITVGMELEQQIKAKIESAVAEPLPVEEKGRSKTPSFNDILGTDYVISLILSEPDTDYVGPKGGTQATIHKSSIKLFVHPEFDSKIRSALQQAKKRSVSTHILIKTANDEKYNASPISYNEALRRDVFASRLPGIYPFSAMTSDPYTLQDGRVAIAVEQSFKGHEIGSSELTVDDYSRIIFQLLMIGKEYHKHGLTRLDFGKPRDVRFLTENPFEGDCSPRRIISYDFTYWDTFKDGKVEEQIRYDLTTFVNIINKHGYYNYFDEPLKNIWDDIQTRIINSEFSSFAEIANVLSTRIKEVRMIDVADEYQQIMDQFK